MKPIYAVVDLETTGAKFEEGDRIIQLGCCLVQDKQIIGSYQYDINPGRTIPANIEKLTGINNQRVSKAPYFEDYAETFFALLQGVTFVAHNVMFDLVFLQTSFKELAGIAWDIPAIDTVQLAQILYPRCESYRLQDLSREFGLSHEKIHDAGSDAEATAHLLIQMIEKIESLPLKTLEQFLEMQEFLLAETGSLFKDLYGMKRTRAQSPHQELEEIAGIFVRKIPQKSVPSQSYSSKHADWYQSWLSHSNQTPRASQKCLFQSLLEFLNSDQSECWIEAESGIGKTAGYVLAALAQRKPHQRIWISTANILLQHQLLEAIKKICQDLEEEISVASIKGAAHYLKIEALAYLLKKIKKEPNQRFVVIAMALLVWVLETETGDLTECNPMVIVYPFQQFIESLSMEEQKQCRLQFIGHSFYEEVVQLVKEADIVVTNHAFLWHWLNQPETSWLRSENILIVDECHQLESYLLENSKREVCWYILQDLYQDYIQKQSEWLQTRGQTEEIYVLGQLCYRLLETGYEIGDSLSKELDKTNQSSLVFSSQEWMTSSYMTQLNAMYDLIDENQGLLERLSHQYPWDCIELIHQFKQELEVIFSISKMDYILVKIVEGTRGVFLPNFQLFQLPLQVVDLVHQHFDKMVGISATLPHFSFLYSQRADKISIQIEEADRYQNIRLFAPNNLVKPAKVQTNEYFFSLADTIYQIDQSDKQTGKILVLVHSKAALNQIYLLLGDMYREENRVILAQGISMNNRKLYQRFKELESGLLLGLYSFWEGYDAGVIPISGVVITKLPFPNPDSPQQQIYQKYCQINQLDYFSTISLPMMLQTLKQGMGRIMRSEQPTGKIWLLDSRIASSSYSKAVKGILPSSVPFTIDSLANCFMKNE